LLDDYDGVDGLLDGARFVMECLRIAKDAVEEGWEPSRVRRAIEESTRAFAAGHHLS
jgi:hypothetical protein